MKNFIQSETNWQNENVERKVAGEIQEIGMGHVEQNIPKLQEDLDKLAILAIVDNNIIARTASEVQAKISHRELGRSTEEQIVDVVRNWASLTQKQPSKRLFPFFSRWTYSYDDNPLIASYVMTATELREFLRNREAILRKLQSVIVAPVKPARIRHRTTSKSHPAKPER